MLKRALTEAAGTFLLVLVGAGSVVLDVRTGGRLGSLGVALAFTAAVTTAVYAFGRASGAHINPAVTMAFWSVGHFPGREVLPYVGAQCAGASAAASLLRAALGLAGNLGATVPDASIEDAFVTEWLLSFILMFVIIYVATAARVFRAAGAPVIGLTVGLDAFLGGSITGASMNPARSLGPALASGAWEGHWIYWVAPITGMIAAAHAFEFLRRRGEAEPKSAAELPLGMQGPLSPVES